MLMVETFCINQILSYLSGIKFISLDLEAYCDEQVKREGKLVKTQKLCRKSYEKRALLHKSCDKHVSPHQSCTNFLAKVVKHKSCVLVFTCSPQYFRRG
jgi:hypothetical protein